jgi:hypothetical protein
MEIQIQRRSPGRQINVQQRKIPLQEILAVEGHNPIAAGLDVAGASIGEALAKRAALQQQGRQLAALAAMAGEQLPEGGTDLTPDMYEKGLALKTTRDAKTSEAANKRVDRELELEKVRRGYKEILPDGSTRVYEGVQDAQIEYDAAGNPRYTRGEGYRPGVQPMKPPPTPAGNPTAKLENQLRTQYLNESKEYKEASSAYQRVIDSSKNPSPAGDLSLIFNYMKTLDPTSTVRESEFAQAAATGAYGDRIQSAVLGVLKGTRLNDAIRNDFVTRATELYRGQESKHAQRKAQFRGVAMGQGLNPEQVIIDVGVPDGGFQPHTNPTPAKATHRWNPVTGKVEAVR